MTLSILNSFSWTEWTVWTMNSLSVSAVHFQNKKAKQPVTLVLNCITSCFGTVCAVYLEQNERLFRRNLNSLESCFEPAWTELVWRDPLELLIFSQAVPEKLVQQLHWTCLNSFWNPVYNFSGIAWTTFWNRLDTLFCNMRSFSRQILTACLE